MSENTYVNVYRAVSVRDTGFFDLVAMEHETETSALRAATPVMYDGTELVAVAIPVIIDPERARRTVEQYKEAVGQGDVFG